jgi:hypothetical protein
MDCAEGRRLLAECRSTEAVSVTDLDRVHGELRPLAAAMAAAMRRIVGVLVVGSVGRSHADGNSEVVQLADYDLIVVSQPLSDVERLWLRRRIERWLRAAPRTSVPLSFGIVGRNRLPHMPFTLFNYEMRYGHSVLTGENPTGYMPAYQSQQMPLIEATRLLLNRGVVLWGDTLLPAGEVNTFEPSEVARRNDKAMLAIGDALLISSGLYHWSYRQRLANVSACSSFDRLNTQVRSGYEAVLNARISGRARQEDVKPVDTAIVLLGIHAQVFRFVEELRLRRTFPRWNDYLMATLEYPDYLMPSRLKRIARLALAFGLPRGHGFYRNHLGQAPEEVLLRAFPALAYGRGSKALLRTTLNCSRDTSDRRALWRHFEHAWAATR